MFLFVSCGLNVRKKCEILQKYFVFTYLVSKTNRVTLLRPCLIALAGPETYATTKVSINVRFSMASFRRRKQK